MTIKAFSYRGDGAYYLADRAHELDGLRDGPVGRVLLGAGVLAGEQLLAMLSAPPPDAPAAIDVVVAAPKPVSLLLAIEPGSIARRVVAAHEAACGAALDYLVDDGMDGATPSAAVGFTHGVNRLLDPHLHTHVLVAAHDGQGARLERRGLLAHLRAADALYLATLRDGVASATGRRSWRTHGGTTLIEGVDPLLVASACAPRDRDGRVRRGESKQRPTRLEVLGRWDDLVARHEPSGLTPSVPAPPAHVDEYRFAAALGDGGVARRDLVRAWATACPGGERPEVVRRAVDLLAPEARGARRIPARAVGDAVGVRVLGPRPRDLAALEAWQARRRALARYLDAGHRLAHLDDPTGAPARTRLALASLEAELGTCVGRGGPRLAPSAARSLDASGTATRVGRPPERRSVGRGARG